MQSFALVWVPWVSASLCNPDCGQTQCSSYIRLRLTKQFLDLITSGPITTRTFILTLAFRYHILAHVCSFANSSVIAGISYVYKVIRFVKLLLLAYLSWFLVPLPWRVPHLTGFIPSMNHGSPEPSLMQLCKSWAPHSHTLRALTCHCPLIKQFLMSCPLQGYFSSCSTLELCLLLLFSSSFQIFYPPNKTSDLMTLIPKFQLKM